MKHGAMQGRVALVTGAASGLGAETVSAFAREGAEVVYATDNRADQLEKTVRLFRDEGLEVEGIEIDVRSEKSWASVIAQVDKQAGRLDSLVNNAGISGADPSKGQMGTDYWNSLLAVNLTGPFFGIRESWPLLRASGAGAVVNVSSVAAIAGFKGLHAGYSASKGGLRSMTKSFAIEMATDNIRANSLHPGAMPAMQGSTWDHASPEGQSVLRSIVPLGRQAEHSEVAEAVLFLASPRSSYITGVELYVDGGWLAH